MNLKPNRLSEVILVWRVEVAYQDSPRWDQLIRDEWEPFGVTQDGDGEGFLYHLRKLVPILPD
jgi:hypothetical protein